MEELSELDKGDKNVLFIATAMLIEGYTNPRAPLPTLEDVAQAAAWKFGWAVEGAVYHLRFLKKRYYIMVNYEDIHSYAIGDKAETLHELVEMCKTRLVKPVKETLEIVV